MDLMRLLDPPDAWFLFAMGWLKVVDMVVFTYLARPFDKFGDDVAGSNKHPGINQIFNNNVTLVMISTYLFARNHFKSPLCQIVQAAAMGIRIAGTVSAI